MSFGGFNKVVERYTEELKVAAGKVTGNSSQQEIEKDDANGSEEIERFNDGLAEISAEEMAEAHRRNSSSGGQTSKTNKRLREQSSAVKASKEWKKKAKLPQGL